MCDLLCALPAATGGPTLFAKNSDRPPDEQQVFELHPARRDGATLRATHVELPAHPTDTLRRVRLPPDAGAGVSSRG